jgi:hypothetical protein
MGFNLNGLSAYTEENQFDLMTAAVMGAKMFNNATVIPNVKGPSKLPMLSQQVLFQADSCGFNATGDTTITQRTLTPGKVKLNLEWCPKDLEAYYLRTQIAAGSHKEDIKPVEEVLMPYLMSLVANQIDIAIWKGRVTASGGGIGSTVPLGTGNNAFWDGLRFQIQDNTGGYADANNAAYGTALTALNTTTMVEAVFRLYQALADVAVDPSDDVAVFMGVDKYTALVRALTVGGSTFGAVLNAGVNGDVNSIATGSGLTFPGTGLRCIPVAGLNNVNAIYAAQKSNLFLGVDAESDFSNLETWYSKDDRKVKAAMEFKLGTQVAFPAQIAAIVI